MLAAQTLPELPELTVEQAEHWVAAALAEAKALRQHDSHLYPPSDAPAAMAASQRLHVAWAQWADAAQGLYDRVRPLLQSRQHVAGAHDLDYAIARTRAMLSIPPGAMVARDDQARRGIVKSVEEVRRELRVAHRG